MPDPKLMEAAVQAYFEGFRKHDLDIIISLFADDATAEDPVGTPRHEGIQAVRAFYAQSIATGAVLEPQGSTRIAADYAAFAFHAVVPDMGHVEVIDTFRFNEAGKIIEMRAFFGPGNVKMGA
jgi:steroid delta-isomerase